MGKRKRGLGAGKILADDAERERLGGIRNKLNLTRLRRLIEKEESDLADYVPPKSVEPKPKKKRGRSGPEDWKLRGAARPWATLNEGLDPNGRPYDVREAGVDLYDVCRGRFHSANAATKEHLGHLMELAALLAEENRHTAAAVYWCKAVQLDWSDGSGAAQALSLFLLLPPPGRGHLKDDILSPRPFHSMSARQVLQVHRAFAPGLAGPGPSSGDSRASVEFLLSALLIRLASEQHPNAEEILSSKKSLNKASLISLTWEENPVALAALAGLGSLTKVLVRLGASDKLAVMVKPSASTKLVLDTVRYLQRTGALWARLGGQEWVQCMLREQQVEGAGNVMLLEFLSDSTEGPAKALKQFVRRVVDVRPDVWAEEDPRKDGGAKESPGCL